MNDGNWTLSDVNLDSRCCPAGDCGWSYLRIGEALNISKSAAQQLAVRAAQADISWPLPDGVDEERLEATLYDSAPPAATIRSVDVAYRLKKRLLGRKEPDSNHTV